MQNNPTSILAVLGASLLLSGCATSGHVTDAHDGSSRPETQANAASTDPTVLFTQAVKAGDDAWQRGELDRAVYQYVLALQQSPQDATVFAKIGAIEEGRGNLARAQKAFEMAHAAAPEDARIGERLGRLYLQQDNVDQASEIFVHILSQHPQRPRALDGMGEVFRRQGKLRQALLCFDQALQAPEVDVAETRTHRGYARLLTKDMDGAREDLRAALAAKPLPETWLRIADLQTREHDTAGAFKSLLNIMDAAQAYNQIGVVLLQVKDYRGAAESFNRAINVNPAWYEEAHKNLSLANEYLKQAAGPG